MAHEVAYRSVTETQLLDAYAANACFDLYGQADQFFDRNTLQKHSVVDPDSKIVLPSGAEWRNRREPQGFHWPVNFRNRLGGIVREVCRSSPGAGFDYAGRASSNRTCELRTA